MQSIDELAKEHKENVNRILFYIENHINKIKLNECLIKNDDVCSMICDQGHMKDFITMCEKYIKSSEEIIKYMKYKER